MALSNMLNEPRRELTESAIGLLVAGTVVGPLTYADYQWAVYMDNKQVFLGMFVGLILFVLLGIVTLGILALTHALGENICNTLDKKGIRLRPRRI